METQERKTEEAAVLSEQQQQEVDGEDGPKSLSARYVGMKNLLEDVQSKGTQNITQNDAALLAEMYKDLSKLMKNSNLQNLIDTSEAPVIPRDVKTTGSEDNLTVNPSHEALISQNVNNVSVNPQQVRNPMQQCMTLPSSATVPNVDQVANPHNALQMPQNMNPMPPGMPQLTTVTDSHMYDQRINPTDPNMQHMFNPNNIHRPPQNVNPLMHSLQYQSNPMDVARNSQNTGVNPRANVHMPSNIRHQVVRDYDRESDASSMAHQYANDSDDSRDEQQQRRNNIMAVNNAILDGRPIILDTRPVPKMKKHTEDSRQDLPRYLDRFEEYCKATYRGNEDLWLDELEGLLSGEALDEMVVMRDQCDRYRAVRNKMVKWYEENEDKRRTRYKNSFESVKPKQGETLYKFSNRLQNLFTRAYPDREVNSSKTLMQRFENAIPEESNNIIKLHKQFRTMESGKAITWEFFQECAKLMDKDVKKQQQDGEEILINLSRPVKPAKAPAVDLH